MLIVVIVYMAATAQLRVGVCSNSSITLHYCFNIATGACFWKARIAVTAIVSQLALVLYGPLLGYALR